MGLRDRGVGGEAHRGRRRRAARWSGLVASLLIAATCASPADDEGEALAPPRVAYVYDDVGRLRAVVDPESETAVYSYDAVGNIVHIDRQASDALAVVEVTPARASVGDRAVVHGTGFADDAGDNTVTFSGSRAAAEVIDSAPYRLTVKVPVDAEPGPVTVEVDGDSSSSPDEIEVGPDRTPAIGELPELVAQGDALTIRGENFSPDPLLDAVLFDGTTYGTIQSARPDELMVGIPPTATSGRVSVATPDGTARTDRDLFIVPEPWTPEVVGFTERVEWDETVDVAVSADQPIGLVTFRGRRGQHVRIDLGEKEADGNCVGVALRAPGGLEQVVDDDAVGATEWACGPDPEFPALVPRLPVTGTYTLVVDGLENAVESLPVTIQEISTDEWEAEQSDRAATEEDGPDESGNQQDDDSGAGDEPGAGQPGGEGADPPRGDGPGGLPAEWFEAAPLEPGPTAPGDGPWVGDARFPVDLSTGLFVSRATDLVVDDVLPLVMGRTYQLTPSGVDEWGFGKGSALDFEMWLEVGSGRRIADLELPSGLRLPYNRTTEGYDEPTAVFETPANPTIFNGSRVEWNGAGWDLVLVGGTRFVFADERRAPLRAVRDPVGNQVVLEREPAAPGRTEGKVLGVYSPSGRHLTLSYDNEDRVTAAHDHLGRTVTYTYDGEGRLARVTYPAGAELGYAYDERHRIVSVTGPGGIPLVTNGYDDEDRVVAQVLADGSTWRFAYATDGSGAVVQAEATDPAGVVRRVGFAGGYWTNDTTAAGTPFEQTVRAERQPETQLIRALVGPDGRRTEHGYDELGSPTSITQAAGTGAAATTEITYESRFHQVASVTDPAGRIVEYRYDRRGNRLAEIGPSGETTYEYDARGRLTSLALPGGGRTEVAYDQLHQATVTDPAGRTRQEWYDAAGRRTVVGDATGRQTRLVYDDLDRLVEVVGPAGGSTTYSFDPLGNLVSHRDAHGNTTTYGHDPLGRVASRTDPLGAVDRYAYDPLGHLVSHTDRRGVVSTFTYDPVGRQTGAAYGVTPGAAESTIAYSYDVAGRLVGVADSAYGTIGFEYDQLDQLVAETTPAGRIDYRYDEVGRRTSMSVEGGPETTYSYDDVGLVRITQGDLTVSAERDDAGRLASLELPNDVAASYDYDDSGAISRIGYEADGHDLGSLGYRYDHDGRRIGLTGDLASTALPDPLAEATHDAGNRLRASSVAGDTGGADADDGSGGHQAAAGQLVYDAAGNLLSDGTNAYTWDARGQLVGVEGEVPARFAYDPLGRRVSKTIDGVTTSYRYDGAAIIQERRGEDEPATYLSSLGIDQVLARQDASGSTTTSLTDGLGSTIGLLDESGEIATTYVRDPFGQTRADGEDDSNPFGFTGREQDETGLLYYRARYYAPGSGRFISEDPRGYAAGDPNLYAYVGNEPTNYVDPSGQCIGTALFTLERTFNLSADRRAVDDAWLAGDISFDEMQAAYDNFLRRAYDNLNDFFILCEAELTIYEFAAALSGAAFPGRIGTTSPVRPPTGLTAGRPQAQLPQRTGIQTPYGLAVQADDAASLAARTQVEAGTQLWRLGTTGRSQAAEAQFWSLEHPSAPGYATRYGLPPQNVVNADFIESGVLRPGTPFVTRPAPSVAPGTGGGIEVVVPEGRVMMCGFSFIGPQAC